MSRYQLLLTLGLASAFVDAVKPEEWNADAAPHSVVENINTGKASFEDLKKIVPAANLKAPLKAAMTETSSEEIPPPPPMDEDDSHVWVTSRETETPTSAAALSSSGMLRREALGTQSDEKSFEVDGTGKLNSKKISQKKEGSGIDESFPSVADLGEDQMHLLEDVDGEEANQQIDERSLFAARQASLSEKTMACSQYKGQQACDTSGADCGWRTVSRPGDQPFCSDCNSLPQVDCTNAQDKGAKNANYCIWTTKAGCSSFVQLGSSLAEKQTSGQAKDEGASQSMAEQRDKSFSYGKDAAYQVPVWFHGGADPAKTNDLRFEYQSAIGRDGFEPDPTEPSSEFFGPFKIDYHTHTVVLNNWNFAMGTRLKRGGMGNLVVGPNQTTGDASNSVALGSNNVVRGRYSLVAGEFNMANGRGAVVTGGQHNKAVADYSTVAGGMRNNVTAHFATVQGGHQNSASAPFAGVNGGDNGLADGFSSVVSSGTKNHAMANLSAVLGGMKNQIPAEMVSQTIPGGERSNVPTQPPNEVITIEPGEHVAGKPKEFDSDGEEEEHEDDEENGNPATRKRVVQGGNQIDEDGGVRRRRTPVDDHGHGMNEQWKYASTWVKEDKGS